MKVNNAGSALSGVLVGLIICIVINLVMTSVFAWLISKAYIAENKIGYVCAGILILSTLIGTSSAVKKANKKPLFVAVITAAMYLLTMISMNAMFFEGTYEGVAATSLCIAGSSMCSVMLVLKQKKPRRNKRVK